MSILRIDTHLCPRGRVADSPAATSGAESPMDVLRTCLGETKIEFLTQHLAERIPSID